MLTPGRLWEMASPFAGPTAVADVIKDLDTQIAVSKLPELALSWHAGLVETSSSWAFCLW